MGKLSGFIREQIKGKPHLVVEAENHLGTTLRHTHNKGARTLLLVHNFDVSPNILGGIKIKDNSFNLSCFRTKYQTEETPSEEFRIVNKRDVTKTDMESIIRVFCQQGPEANIRPSEVTMTEAEMAAALEEMEKTSAALGTQQEVPALAELCPAETGISN